MNNWKDLIKKESEEDKKSRWNERRMTSYRKDMVDNFFEENEIKNLELLSKVFNLLQDNEFGRYDELGDFLTKMQTDAIDRIEKVENPKIIKKARELIEKGRDGVFEEGLDEFIEALELKYNIAIY